MNHSFFKACSEYISSSAICFDWFDLGSCGAQDLYFLPLYLNPGTYLSVDGRDSESLQQISSLKESGFDCTNRVVRLNNFISDKEGWAYLYETAEGTGSTFFPSRDLDIASLKPSDSTVFKRVPVKAISLSSFLIQNNIKPFFGKIDLEGSEEQVLLDLFSHHLAPLVIEIEINVGSLSESRQGMDTHTLLSNNGYRLIDLRKTYDFPVISSQSSISTHLSEAQSTSVAFQGILHQFDGLYVHTSLFDSNDMQLVLQAIYCLSMYRQFHLSARLVETGIKDSHLREICFNFLDICFAEFSATMNINSSCYLGMHPWFNWLKSH